MDLPGGAIPFSVPNLIFCTLFFVVNIGVTLVELLLRENDWSRYGLTPDQVYPWRCLWAWRASWRRSACASPP